MVAVYLMTAHAYRTWREDHPPGYVQRREGLKAASERLAGWRAGKARGQEARFARAAQVAMHDVVVEVARERGVRLHAVATCPTHVHVLLSFESPACGDSRHCWRGCGAKKVAEGVFVRMKRKMGQRVARMDGTCGKHWFSRGWDTTPVRGREHFDYLVDAYLPKHEREEAGVFRVYR